MSNTQIRRATEADVPAIVGLIEDLAEYENAREECLIAPEQLRTALFGSNPALFAHVAEADGVVCGTAVWFLNFSTWTGHHGIYLEDLYVKPEQRGTGLGKALLSALAAECVANGYTRLDWAVLDWNTPSIKFYDSIGANPQSDWITYRLQGPALAELASDR
ncbi:GNAT family N-acetyltransferase [Mycobacteroides franklinii]|uniref:GNAT family N-acetyltransferase n=1 Tax=Mycobacteroides franklinii TaxID=948102 RepID=A0A4V3HV00_9MYCO|nr:GNAT family N-acetyltransferase [Mycobacteroides franklinii]ORA58337.1 GNAT family N-acetyltransferase [Mycobacteroides franklinii]TDH19869.1 GNAT family N-acetyltransferase [Mycobacteroides franklinii]TDZ43188.1 Phosphinothricin N-acetyltransferase [Mycobacteroides franklinii]TDZ50323.1 Phosphinothricin N-acetyltransferase [Mycobacteroides franklinii]TDZ56743.1 Phosphinothricin N-acetyltransferase [Mycobacteroides franklinii]